MDKIHYIRELRDQSINCSGKKTATNKGVSKLDFYPPQTSKWCISGVDNFDNLHKFVDILIQSGAFETLLQVTR